MSDKLRFFFGRGPGRARIHLSALAIAVSSLTCVPAQAFDSYENGHITRVSYYSDLVLISVDSGVPTNCSATPSGWIAIPAANKAMQAFVTGLWMRGDAPSRSFTFYTGGIGASGFCELAQLDTQSAG